MTNLSAPPSHEAHSDPEPHARFPERASSTDSAADLPRESPRTILFQFVVFPLGVVLIGVVVFFLFGKLASEEHPVPDYVQQIGSGSRTERKQAAFELAKALKRGEAKRYPNLEQQVIDLYRRSNGDDPMVRRYLTVVLGDLRDRRATPLLLDAMKDDDAQTRIYAIWALGEVKDPAALPALIRAAGDEDGGIRKVAVYSLGEIGSREAADAIAGRLEDPVADVRFNAAVALARLGDRRALGTLRDMLDRQRLDRVSGMRDDQKDDALIVAITSYAKLAGRDSAGDLQRLASSDPSLRVRSAAKGALEQLRQQ